MILLRQDPPFDLAYITTTHLLERIHPKTLVVNDPAQVRNAPEKMFVMEFPDLMPPTLITRDLAEIKAFRAEHGDIVMKPLYGKGGEAVFRLAREDLNFGSLYDLFAVTFREQWVVQKFLPGREARRQAHHPGRRRVRRRGQPRAGAGRSALQHGARRHAEGNRPHRARARDLRRASGRRCASAGCIFVGIDVIDGFLTEINVTSPTGIRAVKNLGGPDVAAMIWDKIEAEAAALTRRVAPAVLLRPHPEGARARWSVHSSPACARLEGWGRPHRGGLCFETAARKARAASSA